MALLGQAALAMWWDMAPAVRDEFEHWHSHEHFPERMGIPGFLRGSRWADAEGGDGFFILYELAFHDTLSSPAYLERLNDPTPWSRKLMPHHANMIRTQCVVAGTSGGAVARHALTVRFASGARLPDLGAELAIWAARPGISGAHLLKARAPAIPATEEQRIRGHADRSAESVVIVCGYDLGSLMRLRETFFAGDESGLYGLALSMVGTDTR